MKYIHLDCLKRNLKSRMLERLSNAALSVARSKLCCDLCKKKFPYKISVGHQTVNLMQIPRAPGSFVALETLTGTEKTLYLAFFHKNATVVVGRTNECDLRLPDMSVSRTHAAIHLANGRYYVEDKGSKFGTLVGIGRPIPIQMYSPLTVQAGRSVLTLMHQRSWAFLPACFSSAPSPFEMSVRMIAKGANVFPISTGIPLSVGNQEHLLSVAGVITRRGNKTEEAEAGHYLESSVDEVEEVEVAALSLQTELSK